MNRNLPFNRTEIILKPKKPPSIKGRTLKIPHPFLELFIYGKFQIAINSLAIPIFSPYCGAKESSLKQ